jgi:hypothetical protein
MRMPGTVKDDFWTTDLEDIERGFLGERKVVELPIMVDPRVPGGLPAGIKRIVDVDAEVERCLAKARPPMETSWLRRFLGAWRKNR